MLGIIGSSCIPNTEPLLNADFTSLFLSFDVLQEGEKLKLFCVCASCHFYRLSFPADILHRNEYKQGDRAGSQSPSVAGGLPRSHVLILVCVSAGARLFCATYFLVFCQTPLFMEGTRSRSKCQQEELAGQE